MIKNYFHRENSSLIDKFLALDFILIFLIILLGLISFFAMYSSERGVFDYYTTSHVYRFFIFLALFFLISFININLIFKSTYIFYFVVLFLLVIVDLYGVSASGSKRWIKIFFINLQPSELMKVTLIMFLARYYHKIPSKDVSNIKFMVVPIFALFIPVALVVDQPDLGTALLIALSGISVIWLTGFRFYASCNIYFKALPKI